MFIDKHINTVFINHLQRFIGGLSKYPLNVHVWIIVKGAVLDDCKDPQLSGREEDLVLPRYLSADFKRGVCAVGKDAFHPQKTAKTSAPAPCLTWIYRMHDEALCNDTNLTSYSDTKQLNNLLPLLLACITLNW